MIAPFITKQNNKVEYYSSAQKLEMRVSLTLTSTKMKTTTPFSQKIITAIFAAAALSFIGPALAFADTVSSNFENPPYTVGNINGQDSWSKTGGFDVAVVSNTFGFATFGSQSLRTSDSVTSDSFGDQTFAKPLADSVGETSSTASTFSPGTKQRHFEMQFDFASVTSTYQPGMHVSVSPDRGDGSRMSYLRFEDSPTGVNVFFDDVQQPTPCTPSGCANFVEIQAGTNLSRTAPHAIKLTLDVVDGPGNDVVKVYIDNALVHTGTSWEDYYRYDPEASAEQSPRIVKTVLFRESGTASTTDAGKGFLIDNLSLLSGPATAPTPTTVKVTIDKFIDGVQATTTTASSSSFTMNATWNATNIGADTGSFPLSPTGFNSPNPYEAVTSDMTTGASYSTNEVLNNVVASSCTTGTPYALVGYKIGDTLAQAQSASTTTSSPNFTNLTSNKVVLVLNQTCRVQSQNFLKVHILKFLDGQEATASSSNNYQFPMTATWQTANLNGGAQASGNYPLGTNFGGASSTYGADTASMQAPADYSTSEITNDVATSSQVLPTTMSCVAGKFRLLGYKTSSSSFEDAFTQPTSTAATFTGLNSDQFVLVLDETCPTTASLTVQKDAIGGNATFSFTGDNGIGPFDITTVSSTGSVTFSNLKPGTYHITEASTTGWRLVSNDCSTVAVTAGGAPVCVITNSKNSRLGEIRGTKFEDRDGNGKLADGDHHRLSGWTIFLDTNNNGVLNAGEPMTVTDDHGNYRFIGLVAGTYHVREVQQSGWMQTVPSLGRYDVSLAAGQIAKKKNFGNFQLGTVSGQKFNDKNGNGNNNHGEPGLSGWTIRMTKLNSNVSLTTTTDADGNYSFPNLGPGTYRIREVQKTGWVQTTKNPKDEKITSGENSSDNDFGNHLGRVRSDERFHRED